MAGATLDGQLNPVRAPRTEFAPATSQDDAGLRQLLRENPMRGQVTLTLEREPSYFSDADIIGQEKQTIVAREGGRIVCSGSCSIRKRFVNSQPCRAGYLGGLRLDVAAAGRFDILRRGYECFRELQALHPAEFYFTSIAADNERARSFLERGVRGMPRYELIGEMVTLLLPVIRTADKGKCGEAKVPAVEDAAAFLNEHNARYQFAECWTQTELMALSALGLSMDRLRAVQTDNGMSALGAVWDQRSFKQTVIQEYSWPLSAVRPVINLAARCLGRPALPRPRSRLAQAFVSPIAIRPEVPGALRKLVNTLAAGAVDRGIEYLTLGFSSLDPRLEEMRRCFRAREYVSRIYVVHWPGLGGSLKDLNDNCLGLDVAWL